MKPIYRTSAGALAALAWTHSACAMRLSDTFESYSYRGYVAGELATLPGHDDNPVQVDHHEAVKLQLEGSANFGRGISGAVRAYYRDDATNNDRDDLRLDEAWLQYLRPGWDLRVGSQVVTWGSVESVSPLDVINPREYEEDIVEPFKVGLPMARFRLKYGSDDLSMYWLPLYEASQFAGPQSYYSISGGVPVNYPLEKWYGDQWAVRGFHAGDGFDIGVSWLHSLERNPGFEPVAADNDFGIALEGYSYRSNRYGVEATKTLGDLVLKTEAVYRTSEVEGNRRTWLYALGAEYTVVSIIGHSDLSFFSEYLGTSRNVKDRELMQNDWFSALRWVWNDLLKQRTQFGVFWDLDNTDEYVLRFEHSVSPYKNFDTVLRLTHTRKYYPAPEHADEGKPGVVNIVLRYNF